MGLFYRDNASKKEKFYTKIAFVFAIVFIWTCMHLSSFKAEAWLVKSAAYLSIPISIYIYYLMLKTYLYHHLLTFHLMKRVLLYPSSLLVVYLFVFCSSAMVFPSLFTLIFGNEYTSYYELENKIHRRAPYNDCRYEFKLKDIGNTWHISPCVTKKAWDAFNVGDILHGSRKVSIFGSQIKTLGENK